MKILLDEDPAQTGSGEKDCGLKSDDHLYALISSPSIFTMITNLQKDAAIMRLDEIFSIIQSKEMQSTDLCLAIYYSVSHALVLVSLKTGVDLAEWAGEDTDYLLNNKPPKQDRELREWCLRMICKYMDYMSVCGRGKSSTFVEQTKAIIHRENGIGISLKELAKELFIHPNYLCTRFRQETGLSIFQYVIMIRFEKAKELLAEPGTKIYNVSEKVGYANVSHFNRIFRREIGMNPKDYQNKFIKFNKKAVNQD
jgi:two-component system response regulator YesN